MLAAKASLCARVDALGEESAPSIGIESRAKVEDRVRLCEQNKVRRQMTKLCTYMYISDFYTTLIKLVTGITYILCEDLFMHIIAAEDQWKWACPSKG